MSAETLYDTLEVSKTADSSQIRNYVLERLDQYQSQIEGATNPAETERRYVVAFEVLTNPREKYLYDLLGHNKYVRERLTEDVFEAQAPDENNETQVFASDVGESSGTETRIFTDDSAGGDVDTGTVVFDEETAGDSGDEDTAQTSSKTVLDSTAPASTDETADKLEAIKADKRVVQDLLVFRPANSPLHGLPGLQSDSQKLAEIGYLVSILVLVGGLAYVLPYGGVALLAVGFTSFALGAATTYTLAALKYRRSLLKRTTVAVLAAVIPVGIVLFVGPEISVTTIAGSAALALAGIFGVNTHVEATRKYHQQSGEWDQQRLNNQTATDPTEGESTDSNDAEALLEQFVAHHRELVPTVPSDFLETATVHQQRRIVAERHITRKLFVKDVTKTHEQPASELPFIRNQYREDVQNIDNNCPTDYSKQTYEYIVPQSITEQVCPRCSGNCTVACPKCSGSTKIPCRQCNGDTRNQCGKCNGNGRVKQQNGSYKDCQRCGANGYISCDRCTATGTETCPRCSGTGDVDCSRCETDGKIVRYQTLTRTYSPEKHVSYVTRSVPKSCLDNADGVRIKKEEEQNSNPDASNGDLFREEKEEREISVTVITYEYADNLWELYEIEDSLFWPKRPRNLSLRYKLCSVCGLVCFGLFLAIGLFGTAAIP